MDKIGIIAFNSASKTLKMKDSTLIKYVDLDVTLKQESYLGKTIKEMTDDVKKYKEIPKTSQPTTAQFLEAYEDMLTKYEYVIVLTPSKDLSGTHQNAILSKTMLEEDKQNKIKIIETKSFALSESLLCDTAIDLIEEGKDLNEIVLELESIAEKITTFIIPGNFEYLKMSGRINLFQMVVGKLMFLKLLIIHKKGIAEVHKKAREFKRLLKGISEEMAKKDNIEKIYISGLEPNVEQYEKLKEILEKTSPVVEAKDGSIIMAAHFGPETLGYLLLEK